MSRAGPGLAPALLAGLLSAACSLAGDVTPPATAQMAQPLPTAPIVQQISPPSTQPDLSAGALIYAEKCAACHGTAGMGDGEMAAALQFPPPAIGDPVLARKAIPQEWYETVTLGNLDRLMPGFVSLTDQERWDVVGYALSLNTPPDGLTMGEALFEGQCRECHDAAEFGVPYFREHSLADAYQVIDQGQGEEMPAFASSLTEDERWTVAGYVQSLGWSGESAPIEELGAPASVRGQVLNGTVGAALPAGLEVRLFGFDGDQEAVNRTVFVDSEGQFEFEAVEAVPGRLFVAALEYQGVLFRSELAHAPLDGGLLQLPLTIYETSPDSSMLTVERLHLLIDFPAEDVIRVLELWVVGNRSDTVITSPLRIPLPAESFNLTFEEGTLGERFELTEEGFLDREPIPPGSGIDQLAFAFDLPRSGWFEQAVQQPVEAVTVLVPSEGPKVSGLQDQGVRDLGGLPMRNYVGGSLQPGESLRFRVNGPAAAPSTIATTVVGGAALLGAGLVAARWWVLARSRGGDDTEELLRAMARLDDEYEAGSISEQAYRRQRAALKQRALTAMGGEGD